MNNLKPKSGYINLSQSLLNLLTICPPQFKRIYIDKLSEPSTLKYQQKAQWGKDFHLLMEQYNLTLNIKNLPQDNLNLLSQVEAVISQTSEIWSSSQVLFREAEYQVNKTIGNYLFTAIYDLLVFYPQKAKIIDWKTYALPQNKENIINNWQTKLYLYLLVENFDYLPEQVVFEYWFIPSANNAEKYSLQYDRSWHEKITQELNLLLQKLDSWLEEDASSLTSFPHHTNCSNCPYFECFKQESNHEFSADIITSLDDIPTITPNTKF